MRVVLFEVRALRAVVRVRVRVALARGAVRARRQRHERAQRRAAADHDELAQHGQRGVAQVVVAVVQVEHGEQAARALGPVLAGQQQRARLLGVAARAQRAAQRARPAQRRRQLGAHRAAARAAAARAAAAAAALHVHRV